MMSNADPQELLTSLNFSGTTFDPTDLLSVADILNTYK